MSDYLSVQDQIQCLFDEVLHAEGRTYTLQEVATATGISIGTISQMKNGKIQNPQLNTLRELCHFFGVPLRFFETSSLEECYAIIHRDDDEAPRTLSEIAMRATALSPEAQQDILRVISWVQAAEQLRESGVDLPPLPNLEGYDDD